MRIKKYVGSLATASVLTLSLAACGGSDEPANTAGESSSSTTSSSSSAPSSSTPSSPPPSSTPSSPSSSSSTPSSSSSTTQSGSGDSEEFCNTITSAKDDFSGLSSGTMTQADFDKMISTFNDLSDQAPAEVKQEMTEVATLFSDMDSLMKKYNITFDDIQGMQQGQTPQGVSQQDLMDMSQEMQKLDLTGLTSNLQAVGTFAQSECGVQVG